MGRPRPRAMGLRWDLGQKGHCSNPSKKEQSRPRARLRGIARDRALERSTRWPSLCIFMLLRSRRPTFASRAARVRPPSPRSWRRGKRLISASRTALLLNSSNSGTEFGADARASTRCRDPSVRKQGGSVPESFNLSRADPKHRLCFREESQLDPKLTGPFNIIY